MIARLFNRYILRLSLLGCLPAGVVLEPLEIQWEPGDNDYVQACNEREAFVATLGSRLEPIRFKANLQRHSWETVYSAQGCLLCTEAAQGCL